MKRYVIRRLLMAIPLLLAISFVCFVFINLIPSNPADYIALHRCPFLFCIVAKLKLYFAEPAHACFLRASHLWKV